MLVRLVGHAAALDMLLTARRVGADEALQRGLVNAVYPAASFADDVRSRALELANSVSPRSTRVMKEQVWRTLGPAAGGRGAHRQRGNDRQPRQRGLQGGRRSFRRTTRARVHRPLRRAPISSIAAINAVRSGGSDAAWPASATMRNSAFAPGGDQIRRRPRRTEEVIAPLRDDAGDVREPACAAEQLAGRQEEVPGDVMPLHIRRPRRVGGPARRGERLG